MGTMGIALDKKQAKMQKNCKGCVYMGTSVRSCDYILVEEVQRPCPPGELCTVKRLGKKIRTKEFVEID